MYHYIQRNLQHLCCISHNITRGYKLVTLKNAWLPKTGHDFPRNSSITRGSLNRETETQPLTCIYLCTKAGFSGRLAVSHSRSRHVSFLSPSHPPALQQQAVAFRLQHICISFLSPSQHHHSRLNHFRIYFLDNKLRKQLYKNLKYDI
jgi:hypothetical protein